MKRYWSRSLRVSWDSSGLWTLAKHDHNVPKRFLQLVSISVLCFQNCAKNNYSAVSCTDTNDFQESALHCNWNHVSVSTLVSSSPVWSEPIDHRGLILCWTISITLQNCSCHVQLCGHCLDVLELPICGLHLDPRGLVMGNPMMCRGFSLSRSLARLDLWNFRFLNPKLKKERDIPLNLSL